MSMMLSLLLLALSSGVVAQSAPKPPEEVVKSSACSEIARSYELWTKNGGHGDFSNIPGKTAYNCLMSMPFDSQRAVRFIDEYLKYLHFQSTLESLKHPPPGYITPSIDLLAGFSKIRTKAQKSVYKSQYNFDNAIKSLLHRANEGHLELHLCSHQIFRFHRSPALVSVSSDGLSIPKIYTWSDAKLLHSGFPTENLSHLVEINSVSVEYFLQAHLGLIFEYHDPDARWNHLFPWPVNQFTGFFTGGGWQSYQGLWPGAAQYILKFGNGTTLEVNTTASWATIPNGPMNYTDGQSLWKAACLPGYQPSLQSFSDPDVRPPSRHHDLDDEQPPPSTEGIYPSPVIRTPHDSLMGYYLLPPHNDTAVLQIPTFRHTAGTNFSQTALNFLSRASSRDNKTKLIIDLSGNNGGDVVPGLNIFKIPFPDLPIRTATRFRVTELVRLMVKVYSGSYNTSSGVSVEEGKEKEVPIDPPFVASVAVGPDQKKGRFGKWEDLLFGPPGNEANGVNNMSRSLGHFDLDLASTMDEPVFGYGPFAWMRNGSRPFKAENIVVITNGQCASTCALLISLLRRLPGIRTLTFGGRPRLSPMQAVGGVKGGQYWSLSTIYQHVSKVIDLATSTSTSTFIHSNTTLSSFSSSSRRQVQILTDDELQKLQELAPVSLEEFPLRLELQNGAGAGGVNFRDLYYLPAGGSSRPGDSSSNEESTEEEEKASKVPAQFIYEPADCRRFITAEMLFRPARMWEVAREVMFEDGDGDGQCVNQGT